MAPQAAAAAAVAAAVRRHYRALSVCVHPDKCGREGAADAFAALAAAHTAVQQRLGAEGLRRPGSGGSRWR